jgi:enoyl-CoA hydratase
MTANFILYTSKEHIAYITLNRPDAGNRVNLAMSQELTRICSQINGDKDIYLAVVTGSGEAFCAGGEPDQDKAPDAGEEIPAGISVSEAIASINHPTIAAINGDAIGEGLEIALSCDLRLASDKARFGLPQIINGRIPVHGGTQRLPRIVGRGKALEMVLTGEIIDAPTALEIGLVNKVIGYTGLNSEIDTIAKNIAGKAPWALQYVKEAVNKGLDLTLEQGLRLEADLYFLLHTTSDRTEGITSFLQKRQPKYKGE